MSPEHFFDYSRRRHQVYLDRRDGKPAPWTDDPVMANTRFTNIFRELDRVTVWFRQQVRDPLRNSEWVVPATVIFRWFNRIETGEAIAPMLREERFDPAEAEALIRAAIPKGPWVTGSYMVCSGRNNGDKLQGMLDFCRRFLDWWRAEGYAWWYHTPGIGANRPCLREAHEVLVPRPGLSGFTAYEVVTDLRWTDAVNPHDRLYWAHAGPGATRGGSRVLGKPVDHLRQESKHDQETLRQLMTHLLALSRSARYWPQGDPDWPLWEMREVEHTLCEFDKYERVRRDQGRAKNRFRPDLAGPLLPSGLGI